MYSRNAMNTWGLTDHARKKVMLLFLHCIVSLFHELDLFADLAIRSALWPPKQKSTYSNVNFDLLGLVLENITGISYGDYIDTQILGPLGMNMSSFVPSNDSFAVLPKLPTGPNYWDIEEGVQRP